MKNIFIILSIIINIFAAKALNFGSFFGHKPKPTASMIASMPPIDLRIYYIQNKKNQEDICAIMRDSFPAWADTMSDVRLSEYNICLKNTELQRIVKPIADQRGKLRADERRLEMSRHTISMASLPDAVRLYKNAIPSFKNHMATAFREKLAAEADSLDYFELAEACQELKRTTLYDDIMAYYEPVHRRFEESRHIISMASLPEVVRIYKNAIPSFKNHMATAFREKLAAEADSLDYFELAEACQELKRTMLYDDIMAYYEPAHRRFVENAYAMLDELSLREQEIYNTYRAMALRECDEYMDERLQLIIAAYTIPSISDIIKATSPTLQNALDEFFDNPLVFLWDTSEKVVDAIFEEIKETLSDCGDLLTGDYDNAHERFSKLYNKSISADELEQIINSFRYEAVREIEANRAYVLEALRLNQPLSLPCEHSVDNSVRPYKVSVVSHGLSISELEDLYIYTESLKWGSRAVDVASFIPKYGKFIFLLSIPFEAMGLEYVSNESKEAMRTFGPKLQRTLHNVSSRNVNGLFDESMRYTEASFEDFHNYVVKSL